MGYAICCYFKNLGVTSEKLHFLFLCLDVAISVVLGQKNSAENLENGNK